MSANWSATGLRTKHTIEKLLHHWRLGNRSSAADRKHGFSAFERSWREPVVQITPAQRHPSSPEPHRQSNADCPDEEECIFPIMLGQHNLFHQPNRHELFATHRRSIDLIFPFWHQCNRWWHFCTRDRALELPIQLIKEQVKQSLERSWFSTCFQFESEKWSEGDRFKNWLSE